MNIDIIAVGKLKKEYIPLSDLYSGRISNYADLTMNRIRHSDKKKESGNIIKMIRQDHFTVLFDPKGKTADSGFFAGLIAKHAKIQFVIGGSEGVTEEVRGKCDTVRCVSHLIFPHQLFRIMVLEQIYRGYSIFNDHPYHRE